MGDSKIDPELEEEMSAVRAAGRGDRSIQVIIEVTGQADVPRSQDRTAALQGMERQVQALQKRLMGRLDELGVLVQRSLLANALFTALRPDQITEIAQHPDVKAIRLNREQQVTT